MWRPRILHVQLHGISLRFPYEVRMFLYRGLQVGWSANGLVCKPCWILRCVPGAQAYRELRFEGVEEHAMQHSGAAAEADLRSCAECGALPYFSCVRCSCRWAPGPRPTVHLQLQLRAAL